MIEQLTGLRLVAASGVEGETSLKRLAVEFAAQDVRTSRLGLGLRNWLELDALVTAIVLQLACLEHNITAPLSSDHLRTHWLSHGG